MYVCGYVYLLLLEMGYIMMVSIKGIGCWLYMGVVVVLVVVVMVVYVDMLILNVLYDVMCELYKDINVSFVVVYK